MTYSRPEIALGQASKTFVSSPPKIVSPRVSVIVTCFNYARYVGQALDSVASQTFKNFACVVVDDASVDGSDSIIHRWIEDRRDSRFRLIRNASNCGQTASLTMGLAATSGEFVACLDADDFWFPDFIQRHVEAHLNRMVAASLSCSDLVQVDDEGRMLSGSVGRPPIEERGARRAFTFDDDHSVRLGENNALEFRETPKVSYIYPGYRDFPWTVTSGMVFRRSALELIMPDDPGELRICTDNYAFVICHYFTGSLAIGSALGAYRKHGNNNLSCNPFMGTMLPSNPRKIKENHRRIIDVMLRHLLDHYDRFATVIPFERTHDLVGILFRKSLEYGISIDEKRLRNTVGTRQILRDKLGFKLPLIRRLASRLRRLLAERRPKSG